jgi:hypothetical protein
MYLKKVYTSRLVTGNADLCVEGVYKNFSTAWSLLAVLPLVTCYNNMHRKIAIQPVLHDDSEYCKQES